MSVNNKSAEIFELGDARARLRGADLDPRNFVAVGPYLEAVREQQNLSLATLSERIHIKASYIEAIERMEVKALPSKAFAIGFVRSYAEALGLDPGEIVERFKDEAGFGALRREAETPAVAAPASPSVNEAPGRLSLIAVLVILGFMVWCAYLVTHPSADAVKRPLRLDGVPLAEGPLEARPVPDRALPATAPVPNTAPEGPAATLAAPPLPVIVEAALLERIEPVYPPLCETAAAPVETVEIAFTVTPGGDVVSERVVSASNPCFERSALNAVKRWRFSPRTIDGAPRPAFEQQATIRFDRPS